MIKVDVHDLIKLKSIDESNFDEILPTWAVESIKEAPYVVVRRGNIRIVNENIAIPVGIRGNTREKRFGCFMLVDNCEKVIAPEQIVQDKIWLKSSETSWGDMLERLEVIFQKWNKKISWGPTGSVGFEVVTNKMVTRKQSDLDLIIKPKQKLFVEEAEELLFGLRKEVSAAENIVIDPIIATKKGWVALSEYASGLGTYLVKTIDSEELMKDIW